MNNFTDAAGITRALEYLVVEYGTKKVVARRVNRRAAQNLADKLDLQYGAIHYFVQTVGVK